MKLSFRLKQILEGMGAWRHGIISEIGQECQIERHRMSGLIHNRESNITFAELAELCRFLIEKHRIPASSLPGILFALEQDDLWSLIASRDLLRHCVGVRGKKDHYRVSWADSHLSGVLLNMLYGFGRDPMFHQPRTLEQFLVPAYADPSENDSDETLQLQTIIDLGDRAIKEFESLPGNCGLICLGSCKSNIVIENVIANIFSTPAYQTQDTVEVKAERSVPFFYRLREDDPHPPSCYAGTWLSEKERQTAEEMSSGIWYEVDGNEWECCPYNQSQDAAIVLYDYIPSSSRLEMVMGGFSGRATSLLAKCLPTIAKDLWPPQLNEQDRQLGSYVVQFDIEPEPARPQDVLELSDRIPEAKATVIRLSERVIRRRLVKGEE